jgi:enterobactin synthetase component D
MPSMTERYFPTCCTPPEARWPAPLNAPDAHLLHTRFDPSQLQADDFVRCRFPPARGVAKRQTEFLAGRLCAREALHRLSGIADTPAVGEHGAPQWPTGVVGSITHGAGRAAAVVGWASEWRALGLDIEEPLTAERAERLIGEILTPGELQRCEQLAGAERGRLVTLTFSLKESLYKALYPLVRRSFYFHDAEVLDWQPEGRARLRLLLDLSEDWPVGSVVEGQFCEFEGCLLSLVAVPQATG